MAFAQIGVEGMQRRIDNSVARQDESLYILNRRPFGQTDPAGSLVSQTAFGRVFFCAQETRGPTERPLCFAELCTLKEPQGYTAPGYRLKTSSSIRW
jgi:hypothetical protein